MHHAFIAALLGLLVPSMPASSSEIDVPIPKPEHVAPDDPLANDDNCGPPDAVRSSLQRRHGLRHFMSLGGKNKHGRYAIEIWTDERDGQWATIIVPAGTNPGRACLADSGARGVYQWQLGHETRIPRQ